MKKDLAQEYLQSIDPVLKERERIKEAFKKYLTAFVDGDEIDPREVCLDEETQYALEAFGCVDPTEGRDGFVWAVLVRRGHFSDLFNTKMLPSLKNELYTLALYAKQWEEEGHNHAIPAVGAPKGAGICVGTFINYEDFERMGIPITLLKSKLNPPREPERERD